MEKELKRCPFCGGKAITQRDSLYNTYNEWGDSWRIICGVCGVGPGIKCNTLIKRDQNGNIVIEKDGRKEAIKLWNTRYIEEK